MVKKKEGRGESKRAQHIAYGIYILILDRLRSKRKSEKRKTTLLFGFASTRASYPDIVIEEVPKLTALRAPNTPDAL